MMSEEYLWELEHRWEARRLNNLSPATAREGRRRLRFKLRWWGLSGSSSSLRVVLQPQEIITYSAGRRGAFIECLAGLVSVAEGKEPYEGWSNLRLGERLVPRRRRRVVVRALTLSTIELGEG